MTALCNTCDQPFDANDYCPRCNHFASEQLPEKTLEQLLAEHPEISAYRDEVRTGLWVSDVLGWHRYRKEERMTPHPGKTPAQRRVLDEIGCGNLSPIMAKATRDKMLRDGLIIELSPDVRPFIGAITFQIRRFEMPIPVHMQWCAAMSDQSEGTGA